MEESMGGWGAETFQGSGYSSALCRAFSVQGVTQRASHRPSPEIYTDPMREIGLLFLFY